MNKFKSKPVEVEAMLYTSETKKEVLKWVKENSKYIYPKWEWYEVCAENRNQLIIETVYGVEVCASGEILIIETKRDGIKRISVCGEIEFMKSYEPILGEPDE